jgi:hypothetical protein
MHQMPTSKWQSEARLTADIEAAEQPTTGERSNDRPFVIVVLGDFLGTTDAVPRDDMGPLHNRQLLDIDRDRVLEQAIDWLVLRDGRYDPLHTDESGMLRSEVCPGLWLAAATMILGDMTTVLKVLGDGLASDEHEAFIVNLRQTK